MPSHGRRRGLERVCSKTKRARRRAVAARDGEVCRGCGVTADLTLDHVIPVARGGSNRIDNLQFLCGDCNQDKADTYAVLGQEEE